MSQTDLRGDLPYSKNSEKNGKNTRSVRRGRFGVEIESLSISSGCVKLGDLKKFLRTIRLIAVPTTPWTSIGEVATPRYCQTCSTRGFCRVANYGTFRKKSGLFWVHYWLYGKRYGKPMVEKTSKKSMFEQSQTVFGKKMSTLTLPFKMLSFVRRVQKTGPHNTFFSSACEVALSMPSEVVLDL